LLIVGVPSLAFLVLALLAHILELELLQHPLSFARDGSAAGFGWAAFVALCLAIGGYVVVYLRAATPRRRFVFGPLVAVLLVVVVTVTPTNNHLHDVAAGALLVWAALFFAVRRLDVSPWRAGGFLLAVVIGVGSVLLVGPQWSQKLLVLIQVAAMNVDARWVTRRPPAERAATLTTRRPGTSGR
jgi:uncharacterized membrane protein